MSVEYVSQDEIEAHDAAMQQVVDDGMSEREVIKDKNKAAIDAAQMVFDEAVKAAGEEADQELNRSNNVKEQMLAAMQRDFECLSLLRQVYHEAPNDVFEAFMSKCFDLGDYGWGKGGLNAFRLANKRCKQVVESCTTKLSKGQEEDGSDSLPIPTIQRCRRIKEIRCHSRNLRSLEGCPVGLKVLLIGNAPNLSDLSPLASSSRMQNLQIFDSSITDISVVSSMPLLEVFACHKTPGRPSIKDLSPLSSCHSMKEVYLYGNHEIKDLFPLSACTALEALQISYCPLITSLVPPSNLINLNVLLCRYIHPQTSLLPLVSCTGLMRLYCSQNAVDLEELKRRLPQIKTTH